jgi:hypothetical protein
MTTLPQPMTPPRLNKYAYLARTEACDTPKAIRNLQKQLSDTYGQRAQPILYFASEEPIRLIDGLNDAA